MKARKGDMVAYCQTTRTPYVDRPATVETVWHLGVVGSATRDGLVKSIHGMYCTDNTDGSTTRYVSDSAQPIERMIGLQAERYVLPLSEGWSVESVLNVVSARLDTADWRRNHFDSVEQLRDVLRPVRPMKVTR